VIIGDHLRALPEERKLSQLKSSSTLTFARALFHAAEGHELFDRSFAFAGAVSTYNSLFHLGVALILAYCFHPAPIQDPHASLRSKLEEKWGKRQSPTLSDGKQYLPDPAGFIDHNDVPPFLERELPEIARSLGARDRRGTLRDMREFVSYAPRMVSNGLVNILYSGCQYEAHDFQLQLNQHLSPIDKLFCSAVAWLRRCSIEIYQRILSGDFVLFEFSELHAYHPPSVATKAFEIYRSICDQENVDWRIWRPDPGTFHTDELVQRGQYEKAVSALAP